MHTAAPPDPQTPTVCLPPSQFTRRRSGGFSLIEVTLAIAIVAFAFIALIGLLPAGMSVFNQTMDATNEMRISSDITALLQATEYSKIPTNPKIVNNTFYFDVDGALIDTELDQRSELAELRIYAARIYVDKQNVPGGGVGSAYDKDNVALKALILVGRNNETTLQLINGVTSIEQIWQLPKQKVRVLPLVLSKTDGKS